MLGPLGGADLTCALWPVAPAPQQPSIDGDGAPPIVVIGTTGDPATPYEYAVDMADRLKSGVLVTYRGEGHLAYGSERVHQPAGDRLSGAGPGAAGPDPLLKLQW